MKYKLTTESKNINGATLYRIEALKDFGDVKAGDLGGWVELESNLSQDGNAWVSDDAKVFDNAKVSDDAQIFGDAKVYDDAKVFGDAEVSGNAQVYGNAQVCGNAQVYGNAWVFGNAKVYA